MAFKLLSLSHGVSGFEESSARDMFCDTLTRSGFEFQEFLISSAQLGVPNSRLRYYLIAKRKSEPGSLESQNNVSIDANHHLAFQTHLGFKPSQSFGLKSGSFRVKCPFQSIQVEYKTTWSQRQAQSYWKYLQRSWQNDPSSWTLSPKIQSDLVALPKPMANMPKAQVRKKSIIFQEKVEQSAQVL